MKLLIGVATYKRKDKLKRCIDSIINSSYKDYLTVVVADNKDYESLDFLIRTYDRRLPIMGLFQKEHKYVIGAWNRIVQENIQRNWDGFIGLCDDVELEPDALEKIVKCHQDYFKDGDGVIGFNQVCPGHPEYTFKWFGQTLMGRKFIERYAKADYQICCPDYKHFFQDQEMYEFAHELRKFYNCREAVLKHYHPGFIKEEEDETHHIIRQSSTSPKALDTETHLARMCKSYLWGRDFNLINGKI